MNGLDMATVFRGVYRAKGFCWLATRHSTVMMWNQAAHIIEFEDGGDWFVTMDEEQWTQNLTAEMVREAKGDFEGVYGDRRQEVVFIGDVRRMEEGKLREILEGCLLTEKE